MLGAVLGSVAGNLIGAGMADRNAAKAAKRNYEYGELAAQNAYGRQIDQWNRENQYNTYKAQRERMEEAGLSVGMMASGAAGASNAGGLSSVPQNQSAGTREPIRGEGYMANIVNALALRKQESEIDVNKSVAERNRAESGVVPTKEDYMKSQTEVNALLGENIKARTAGQLLANNLQEQTMPVNVEIAKQQYEKNKTLLEQYIEDLTATRLQNEFSRGTLDGRMQIVEQDLKSKVMGIAMQGVQIEAAKMGIVMTDAQIDLIRKQWYTESAHQSEMYARSGVLDKTGQILSRDVDWYDTKAVTGVISSLVQSGASILRAGR